MCFAAGDWHMRFVSRSSSTSSTLRVAVTVNSLLGLVSILDGGTVSSNGTWKPSPKVSLLLTNVGGLLTTKAISLRFNGDERDNADRRRLPRSLQGHLASQAVRRLSAMQRSLPVAQRPRRPEWMKVRAPSADSRYFDVKKLIHGHNLLTICEEARCPNISECWGRGTATFQILGDTCTRACRYCYVNSGKPEHPPDPLEPLRLAQTAAQMGLKHVVVTSVDRDDLPDKGAGHYAATIRALKAKVLRRPWKC